MSDDYLSVEDQVDDPRRAKTEKRRSRWLLFSVLGVLVAVLLAGIGILVSNNRVAKVIASHIGTNPETGRQMIAGEIEVELVPQGTLAERIRCGGSGLGGVLTPTGVGTVIEEGTTIINFDGIEYLVERPLRADMAILNAYRADHMGNLVYLRAGRNFNPIMALAADFVVAEVENICAIGEIDPDHVMTPGILVDALIAAEEK